MPDYQPADSERTVHGQRATTATPAHAPARHAHPLVSLQAHAGNQAVARMVQRAAEEEELQAKHDPTLQRAAEEEEELQAKPDPTLQRAAEEEEELQAKHDPALQRAAEEEEELQAKHDPTPRVGLEGGPVGADISAEINAQRGGGSTLDSSFRERMESAFGADFSGVRIHQDSQSDVLNRQLTAKAFTTGNDIFLRSDASAGDGHLMAHELTHVVQQRAGGGPASGGMTAGPANDPQEHEADRTAEAVLAGGMQREAEQESGV